MSIFTKKKFAALIGAIALAAVGVGVTANTAEAASGSLTIIPWGVNGTVGTQVCSGTMIWDSAGIHAFYYGAVVSVMKPAGSSVSPLTVGVSGNGLVCYTPDMPGNYSFGVEWRDDLSAAWSNPVTYASYATAAAGSTSTGSGSAPSQAGSVSEATQTPVSVTATATSGTVITGTTTPGASVNVVLPSQPSLGQAPTATAGSDGAFTLTLINNQTAGTQLRVTAMLGDASASTIVTVPQGSSTLPAPTPSTQPSTTPTPSPSGTDGGGSFSECSGDNGPINVTVSSNDGYLVVGRVSTVTIDCAPKGSTFTYQWSKACSDVIPPTPIPGATSSTYTPTVEDAGSYITVYITPSGGAQLVVPFFVQASPSNPSPGQCITGESNGRTAVASGSNLHFSTMSTIVQSQPTGRTVLALSDFGDLNVLYNLGEDKKTIANGGMNSWFTIQADGNFVLYRADGSVAWASNSRFGGNAGGWITAQADGNVVLYSNATGQAVWQSGTSGL